jgi:CBS domain containing-hemolysin-like protein
MSEVAHQEKGLVTRLLLVPLLKTLRSLKRNVERMIQRLDKVSPSEMIEEELQTLIDEGMQEGVMDKEDEELLHSVIEFGDTLAREVMVPRMDMVALELGTELSAVRENIIEVGHTRVPVYRGTIDHIVGILHSKDLIKVWQSGREGTSISSLLRPVIFIPGSERLSDLLREMKRTRTHLAIVVDEFGGTAGLITLEDIVEEIIGEVEDEFDRGEEELIRKTDGGWLVDTRIGMWELAEKLGISETGLKGIESETVGGLMGELLGRLPRPGEEVPFEEYLFRVAKTDGRRVVKVQIRRSDGEGDRLLPGHNAG